MDVMDAVNLLKKYGLYNAAEAECKDKKLSNIPYDMIGHHKIYCSYLQKKVNEYRMEMNKVKEKTCIKWSEIPIEKKPAHDVCSFVEPVLKNTFCKDCCKVFSSSIIPISLKIQELNEAQDVLMSASEKDYWSR